MEESAVPQVPSQLSMREPRRGAGGGEHTTAVIMTTLREGSRSPAC